MQTTPLSPSQSTNDAAKPGTRAVPRWLQITKVEVEAHLERFFQAKKRETTEISPRTLELVGRGPEPEVMLRRQALARAAVAAAGLSVHSPWSRNRSLGRGGAPHSSFSKATS